MRGALHHRGIGILAASACCVLPAPAADLIVSAQDGKFVRMDGRATFPQPAPPDSLVVIDAAASPPVVKRLALPAGPVSIRSMPR